MEESYFIKALNLMAEDKKWSGFWNLFKTIDI